MSASTERVAHGLMQTLQYFRQAEDSLIATIETQLTNGGLKPQLQNGQQRGRPSQAQGHNISAPARRGRKPAARATQAAGTAKKARSGPWANLTPEQYAERKRKLSAAQKRRYSQKATAAQGNFDRMTGQVRRGRPRKQVAA